MGSSSPEQSASGWLLVPIHTDEVFEVHHALEGRFHDFASHTIKRDLEPFEVLMPVVLLEHHIEGTNRILHHAVVFVQLHTRAGDLTNNGECFVYNLSNRCTHRCSPRPLYESNSLERELSNAVEPAVTCGVNRLITVHARRPENAVRCGGRSVQPTRITSERSSRVSEYRLPPVLVLICA